MLEVAVVAVVVTFLVSVFFGLIETALTGDWRRGLVVIGWAFLGGTFMAVVVAGGLGFIDWWVNR